MDFSAPQQMTLTKVEEPGENAIQFTGERRNMKNLFTRFEWFVICFGLTISLWGGLVAADYILFDDQDDEIAMAAGLQMSAQDQD